MDIYILLAVFGLVATWEGFRPLRRGNVLLTLRWTNNILWYVLNTVVLASTFAATVVVASTVYWADVLPGLSDLGLPVWLEVLIGFLLIDFSGYIAHILLHKSPWLWRLHAIHHSDVDFDCTTGFRFHPLEGLFTSGLRLVVIVGFGISPVVAVWYGIWLGAQNLYGHANVRLPAAVGSYLQWLVVTPDMHRVHHSVVVEESMRNYGIIFPWWDRLFGTFRAEPRDGHEAMLIGLDWWRDESRWSIPRLLYLPFETPFPPRRSKSR